MKSLKLTFITLIISFTTTIKAQDATNDATWEETINFLEGFLPNFNHTSIYEYGSYLSRDKCEYNLKNLEVRLKCITIEENGKQINKVSSVTANILELQSVKMKKNQSSIILTFTGNIVKLTSNSENRSNFYISIYRYYNVDKDEVNFFEKPDSKNVMRLYKAFKHLAYLAGEKRKKSKF